MPAIQRRALCAASSCALMLAFGGCADLQIIAADECGNDVVEPDLGEDCDGEADCGAPGTEHACRIVCTPGPDAKCRDGHTCGLDGVCRTPSGAFEPLSATATATVLDLLTADVNDDGCSEILLSKRQSVTLMAFESDGPGLCPAGEQDIPSGRAPDKELGRPAAVVADMNRDGHPDLVRAAQAQYEDALFVDAAGPTPELGALLYPTLKALEAPARPLTVRVNGEDALLLFLDQPMGMPSIGVAGVLDPKNTPRPTGIGLNGVMADLVILAAARKNTNSVMDHVLFGFAGQNVLLSFDLSMGSDPMLPGMDKIVATVPAPAITLPPGAKLRESNASIAVVHYDDDDTLDVIVNTETGGPMAKSPLYVAYGTGDGRFHSTSPPDQVTPDGGASPIAMMPADPMVPSPESGAAIFVAADFEPAKPGIEIEAIPCPPSQSIESVACNKTEEVGCEAVVFDLDADGRLDIVSTEEQQPGLVVRRPTTGTGFHVSFVDTSCPPHELTIGDFDDDGVTDLAYFDQTVAGTTALTPDEAPVDTLMIAYGNAYAAPSPPAVSGRFPTSQGLVAGRFSPTTLVTQLYAARTVDEEHARSGFALVEGYGERNLFAPYYFPPPPPDGPPMLMPENIRTVSIIAAAGGVFSKDEETGQPTSAVALVTRDVDSGDLGPPILQLVDARLGGSSLIEADTGESPTCDACVLVPIDIPECQGEGGPDELLLLGADEIITYSTVVTTMQERLAFTKCDHFMSTGYTFSFRDGKTKPEKYVPRPLVADLDHDGRADVLARDAGGLLVVLWSQPGGGFEPQALSFPPGPDSGATLECKGKCSAALVDTDGDIDADGEETDGRELLVVAPGGVRLYRVLSNRTLQGLELPPGLKDIEIAGNTDYTAVVAADLDGDGVEDLALMPSSSLVRTLRGVPVNP